MAAPIVLIGLILLHAAAGTEPERWRCGVCEFYGSSLNTRLAEKDGVNRGASWQKYTKRRKQIEIAVRAEEAMERALKDSTGDLLLDGQLPSSHVRREMRSWLEKVVEENEEDIQRVVKKEMEKVMDAEAGVEASKGQPFSLTKWLCGLVLDVCPAPENAMAVTASLSRTRDEYDL
eukprot:Sspe_Gene.89586::Locus_61337_Transcript_3_3_Confidence_0.600_Length_799::g.89586::m.89586